MPRLRLGNVRLYFTLGPGAGTAGAAPDDATHAAR